MDREQRIDCLVTKILSGDESLIYELWRELDDLCAWYCRKLLRQLPEAFKLEFGDLYNCGFIALCDALQCYSTEKQAKFSKYYLFYLTGAIYRENRLSVGGHYKDGRRRFDPIITGGTISLDAPTDESQETPEPLYNFLSNEQIESLSIDTVEQAMERIYLEQLHAVMEDLISNLPKDQQFLIRQKYYIGADCTQIAEKLNIDRSQIYPLEDRALLTLRKCGQAVSLESFLNDEINYYAGTGITRFKESGSSSTERLALRRIEIEDRFEKLYGKTIIDLVSPKVI